MSQEQEKLLFPSYSFSGFYEAPTTGGEKKARRRRRKARGGGGDGEGGDDDQAKKRRLKDEQVKFLEMSFEKERKLETTRKVHLASELGLDPKQVAVWFQNRRARHKSKQMEDEFAKLRAAHDAIVLEKCHLENEVLKLKEKVAVIEEEKRKLTASATGVSGGGNSSPSSSFSTVTYQPLVREFAVEGDADLTYMSEYTYNNYMMDLAAGFYGMYDQMG